MTAMAAGKTLNVTQLLMGGMPTEVSPVFMTFSARTGANQTQDFIDSKMDKRRKAGSPRHVLLGWLLHRTELVKPEAPACKFALPVLSSGSWMGP